MNKTERNCNKEKKNEERLYNGKKKRIMHCSKGLYTKIEGTYQLANAPEYLQGLFMKESHEEDCFKMRRHVAKQNH